MTPLLKWNSLVNHEPGDLLSYSKPTPAEVFLIEIATFLHCHLTGRGVLGLGQVPGRSGIS